MTSLNTIVYIFAYISAREKNTLFYEEKEKCVLKFLISDSLLFLFSMCLVIQKGGSLPWLRS